MWTVIFLAQVRLIKNDLNIAKKSTKIQGKISSHPTEPKLRKLDNRASAMYKENKLKWLRSFPQCGHETYFIRIASWLYVASMQSRIGVIKKHSSGIYLSSPKKFIVSPVRKTDRKYKHNLANINLLILLAQSSQCLPTAYEMKLNTRRHAHRTKGKRKLRECAHATSLMVLTNAKYVQGMAGFCNIKTVGLHRRTQDGADKHLQKQTVNHTSTPTLFPCFRTVLVCWVACLFWYCVHCARYAGFLGLRGVCGGCGIGVGVLPGMLVGSRNMGIEGGITRIEHSTRSTDMLHIGYRKKGTEHSLARSKLPLKGMKQGISHLDIEFQPDEVGSYIQKAINKFSQPCCMTSNSHSYWLDQYINLGEVGKGNKNEGNGMNTYTNIKHKNDLFKPRSIHTWLCTIGKEVNKKAETNKVLNKKYNYCKLMARFSFLSAGGPIMPSKKYDPRAMAKAPKRLYTWETVTRTSSNFKIPKSRSTMPDSTSHKAESQPRNTYAQKAKDDKEKRKEQRGRDPRRRPKEATEEEDHKLNSILHYLNWVTYEAIPCKERNIQYYEQLADTIRLDIARNEEQLHDAQLTTLQNDQTNGMTIRKLRRQMELKLEETIVKLQKQKKDLEGLNRAQTEHIDKLKAGNKNVKTIISARLLLSRLHNYVFLQDIYKTRCITPIPTSPPRAFVPSTSSLLESHPILSNLEPGSQYHGCLLYTSPSPRDRQKSRMPSSA